MLIFSQCKWGCCRLPQKVTSSAVMLLKLQTSTSHYLNSELVFGDKESVRPWIKHQFRWKDSTSLYTLGFSSLIWIMVFGFLWRSNLRPLEVSKSAMLVSLVFVVIYEVVLFRKIVFKTKYWIWCMFILVVLPCARNTTFLNSRPYSETDGKRTNSFLQMPPVSSSQL